MVACGEDPTTSIHPLCQALELFVVKRVVREVTRVRSRGRPWVIAEEPDLVPVVEVEIGSVNLKPKTAKIGSLPSV